MKKIKQYIKEEIQRLMERDYEAPDEVLGALQNQLEMIPLERYITHLKSVNSIPPSYEIFLHNGKSFLIIYETFSLLAKIGSKEYFLNDIDERNYCKQHINRLLTGPKFPEEEEMEDMEGAAPPPKGGGAPPKLPPLPPLPGGPPPADEE
jgi:hypothetical protein